MNLGAWTRELAAVLSSEDTPVVSDPRDVRVPGGIVMARTITPDRLAAAPYTVEFELILVSAGATPEALDELGHMAGDVLTRWPALAFEALTITDPNLSGGPLPGLTATISTECED